MIIILAAIQKLQSHNLSGMRLAVLEEAVSPDHLSATSSPSQKRLARNLGADRLIAEIPENGDLKTYR